MICLRGKITKLELLTIATLGKGGFGQNKESLKYFVQKRKILRNHIGEKLSRSSGNQHSQPWSALSDAFVGFLLHTTPPGDRNYRFALCLGKER